MLRVDLKATKVAVSTDDGTLGFRALRHTYVTSPSDAEVHPKLAQELARHRTIDLTMNFHISLRDGPARRCPATCHLDARDERKGVVSSAV